MRQSLKTILFGGIDPDAREWAQRAVNVNPSTIRAVSRFIKGCKQSGIWTKLTRVNLICGDDLTAARTPLLVGGGSATETVANIVAGDYVENGTTGGLKGDGTTKSFNTGWNPITRSASTSSLGLWAYVKGTEIAGTSRLILGSQTAAGTDRIYLGWADGGNRELGGLGANGVAELPPAGGTAKEGFLGVAVNGSRSQQYYHNGAASGAAVTATGTFADLNIFGLALNVDAAATAWSTRYLRAYAITTGMSAQDASELNRHMQAFQSAMNRNV